MSGSTRSRSVLRHADDWLLLTTVTVVGAVLRIEALVGAYGPVPLGGRLEDLQRLIAGFGPWIHGGRLAWPLAGPRSGDPLAYLNNARAMTWFYEGRAREPVFNYATKWWLGLVGGADIGVSAASTVASILCVSATYLLGRMAGGRFVGTAAALIVAIDSTMIGWGIQGWRDDTFTLFVLLFAVACLRFVEKPSWGSTVLLTLTTTLALLTRLTAVSFIGPAFLLTGWRASGTQAVGRRRVLRRIAVAAVASAVLVGPYLFNCWQRYGDPFVAVNRNTTFYRERAGQDASQQMPVSTYLRSMARQHPVSTADTALQGLTTYPFRNKFHTLSPWGDGLPTVLPPLAIAGLLAWIWMPSGQLLLLVLASSLVPYAFTWEIRGGAEWRFTMHAYPIFLVAAVSVLPLSVSAFRAIHASPRGLVRVSWRAGVSLLLAAAVAGALWWLPSPRAGERLRLEGQATLVPGWRDRIFFRAGWHPPENRGRGTMRTSEGHIARVHLPLEENQSYHVEIDMAPAVVDDASVLFVRAYINGQQMAWQPVADNRTPVFAFDIVREAARAGGDVLELRGNRVPRGREDPSQPTDDRRFSIWSIDVVRTAEP